MMKSSFHFLLILILVAAQPGIFKINTFAQTAGSPKISDTDKLAARLAAIEKAVGEKRLALGIPGLSLAIVKNDKVIFSKGFGLRDLEKKLPVTSDTLFGIGSSTKAFTSMTVMMSADTGNNGAVTITLRGQPPRRLIEKVKDSFAVEGSPDNFVLSVKRDESGKASSLVYDQGGIVAPLRLVALTNPPSADELMKKVIAATGGESNLQKHSSLKIEAAVDYENQGVTGESVTSAKALNKSITNLAYFALGKKIGTGCDFFDGQAGGSAASVGTPFNLSGKVLEGARVAADFYAPLDWKSLFQSVTVKRMSKIGGEEVYVEKLPVTGNPVTDYISTKLYFVLRRDSSQPQGFGGYTLPKTETFSDYRMIDGVMTPFKIVSNDPDGGSLTTIVKSIQFNVAIADSSFHPSAAKTSSN